MISKTFKHIPTEELEHISTLEDSEDGRFVLVGYGRDEAKLIQINLEYNTIAETYFLKGRYPTSSIIIDNSKAIIGTNNGHIVLIDLIHHIKLNTKQVASEKVSIKSLCYSSDNNIVFVATQESLLAVNYNTFDCLHETKLDFNPWDIILIPNSNILALEGSKIRLELYSYNESGFCKLDTVEYGLENKDMTSISFNNEHQILLSASEKGYIYSWSISNSQLDKNTEIPFENEKIYWIQSIDNFIAFSSNRNGTSFIDIKQKTINHIPNAQNEGEICLVKIGEEIFLAHLKSDGNIGIVNLTNNELDAYIFVNNLSSNIDKFTLTSNGDIVAATKDGILKSNIFVQNQDEKEGLSITEFLFNAKDDSILLQSLESLKVVTPWDKKIVDIETSKDYNSFGIKDFYGNNILLNNYKDICLIDTLSGLVSKNSVEHKNIKIINEDSYALTTSVNYTEYLIVYDFHGNQISSKDLNQPFSSMFIAQDKLLTTYMREKSEILDIQTNQVSYFDVRFVFNENDDVLITNNLNYCININISDLDDLTYDMTLYDLTDQDSQNRAKKVWEVDAPWLASFEPLHYSTKDDCIYIINKQTGEMVCIDKKSSNIIHSYQLPQGIETIKMSNSGNYIAWKLQTDEFDYILYPFDGYEVFDKKTWRSSKHSHTDNDGLLEQKSVAQLWEYAFKRIDTFTFKSGDSEAHQLNPFDYSLIIPDRSYLDNYNSDDAILALLGRGRTTDLKNEDQVATLYHELFHVFQSITTQQVLDYFYYIDDLQLKRVELLKTMGNVNFFTLTQTLQQEFGKSVFHCVENYSKYGDKKYYKNVLNETLAERNKEIDEEIKSFILQYGDTYRIQIEKEGEKAKDEFRKIIEKQIVDNIKTISEQSKNIQKYSNLSRSKIENLINYISFSDDLKLHRFHLIEGSANIWGWACAGYNIQEKLNSKLKDIDTANSSSIDKYIKAYQLFLEYKGKTPLLFIILSMLSLSMKSPLDVFSFGLNKITIWEKDIEMMLKQKQITQELFSQTVIALIDKISNTLTGKFYTVNMTSVHDNKKYENHFLKQINNIRDELPQINSLEFLIDFVIKQSMADKIIDCFDAHKKEFEKEIREGEVLRDFEKFLKSNGNVDFPIQCCNEHKNINNVDDSHIWKECSNKDSFISILFNNFKITIPSSLINE